MKHSSYNLCLIEVRAIVVAVQQPSAECTAIFYCAHCLTPPTSLYSDKTQNLHSSTVEPIPKECPHPRAKVNVLATHPTIAYSAKSDSLVLLNMWPTPHEGTEIAQEEARSGLSIPNNPYSFCLTICLTGVFCSSCELPCLFSAGDNCRVSSLRNFGSKYTCEIINP